MALPVVFPSNWSRRLLLSLSLKESVLTLCRVCGSKLMPLFPSLLRSSCNQKCTKDSALHLAEDLFIASEASPRAGRETLPYLDDDIPLLSVEEETGMCLQCSAFRATTLHCSSCSSSWPCHWHMPWFPYF